MSKFVRRNPWVEVDAVRWTGDNWQEVQAWLAPRVTGARVGAGVVRKIDGTHWDEVNVLSFPLGTYGGGEVNCPVGDWIVENIVTGHLRVVTHEQFVTHFQAYDGTDGTVLGVIHVSGSTSDADFAKFKREWDKQQISPVPIVDFVPQRDERQQTATRWANACFGVDSVSSVPQRAIRMLEEAIELVQACGVERPMVDRLSSHVFSRPVGSIEQEIGGVGVSLLVLANAVGASADDQEHRELQRCVALPREHFAKRDQQKIEGGLTCAPRGGEPSVSGVEETTYDRSGGDPVKFSVTLSATTYDEFKTLITQYTGMLQVREKADASEDRQVSPPAAPPSVVVDQPPPTHRPDQVPVWESVILDFQLRFSDSLDGRWGEQNKRVSAATLSDMRERDRIGRERYGTPLTTNNGRDHLVDAYQELLDAAVYLKAARLESGSGSNTASYHDVLDLIMTTRRLIDERTAAQ